jgi:maltose O-acetyltransferase
MKANSNIRRRNRIKKIKKFIMEKDSIIIVNNSFSGSLGNAFPYTDFCIFKLGKKSLITSSHNFDIVDELIIGDNVVFGGLLSSVWNHGFDSDRTLIQGPVIIGSNIYIGAGTIICQGVKIADNSVIGAGTVVSKSIISSGFYVSNQLIRKSAVHLYSDENSTITYAGHKFYRKPSLK